MDKTLAEKTVIDTCKEWGLTQFQAFLIYSQGLQESGYDSHVSNTCNNYFGMKMPHTRHSPYIQGKCLPAPHGESTPNDPYNFYAKYNSLEDSVKDLLARHAALGIDWNKILTVEDYINFCIHTHYFQGDPAIYASNVKHLEAKYNV